VIGPTTIYRGWLTKSAVVTLRTGTTSDLQNARKMRLWSKFQIMCGNWKKHSGEGGAPELPFQKNSVCSSAVCFISAYFSSLVFRIFAKWLQRRAWSHWNIARHETKLQKTTETKNRVVANDKNQSDTETKN